MTNPDYLSRWGRRRMASCRLFLGVADGACANVGSKCVSEGRTAVTVGTSAAVRVLVRDGVLEGKGEESAGGGGGREWCVPRGLWCYRVDEGRVLIGGALTDGGSVVEWAREFLNLTDDVAFETVLRDVAKGADDESVLASVSSSSSSSSLTVLPFLSGERSTGFRDGAQCVASGFTRLTTPADFLRSCLESVVLRLGAVNRLIDEVVKCDNDEGGGVIVVSGNALEKNRVWRQMVADCLGKSVVLDGEICEGTSRGIARIVAAKLAGGKEIKQEELVVQEELTPRVKLAERWKVAMEKQETLIEAVSPLWV